MTTVTKRQAAPPALNIADVTDTVAGDLDARRELAFDANYEVRMMAEGMKRLLYQDSTEQTAMYVSMLSRIQQLTDIVYFAARLHGDAPADHGAQDSLRTLRRVFEGMMP